MSEYNRFTNPEPTEIKYPRIPETIFDEEEIGATRLKIHGGWIYCQIIKSCKNMTSSSIFIPDPNHEWELEDE